MAKKPAKKAAKPPDRYTVMTPRSAEADIVWIAEQAGVSAGEAVALAARAVREAGIVTPARVTFPAAKPAEGGGA